MLWERTITVAERELKSTRRLRCSRAAMGITYTTQTTVVLNPGLRGELLPFVTADRVPEQNTMKIVC